jgi:hypothetical protein
MTKVVRKLRCAVYTRKSSEEGLEQEFNSLHAQREACEAYIASQKPEGWVLVRDQYDDGGISGATLERPGLKPETLRRLEILGEQYDSDNVTTRRIRYDARPVAGTRLVREYRGIEHTVTVLADGYEWEGRPYLSLSAIARAITGTRWNGLIFFGIKRQGSAA